MKTFLLAVLLAFCLPFIGCKEKPVQTEQTFVYEKTGETMGYLLYLPKGYNKEDRKKWPLLIFFHGSGERGNDLNLVKKHGPPKIVETGKEFPFVIVSPQVALNHQYSEGHPKAFLDHLTESYNVDEKRFYLTGLSMGGFITWDFAMEFPERFAALAPVCGGGNPAKIKKIKDIPVWAFHGAKDDAVPLSQGQVMVDALKKAGGTVKFTVYPEAGHDSWTQTYENPELYEWFLKQSR